MQTAEKKRPWWKRVLHTVVLLRPILKILGVKDKTVVSKGAAVADVVDKATD